VPSAVVVVLVLIVLVGVPVFSYLALNTRRVAGTNFAGTTDKANQPAVAPAKTVGTASDSDSVKSLAAQSPSKESAAVASVASPSASQQQEVKADATAVRIEDGIEVRRALPVGASQSATPVDN
jgi:hypothetical protein